MGSWTPTTIWEGQDAYIIGGGRSLRSFDWSLLHGKNTIGCNDAFKLGVDVCKVCIFGDMNFWRTYYEGLQKFSGMVVSALQALRKDSPEWLKIVDRKARGLHTDAIGWNTNTGAMAVNLALLFGARRVFLLGFDMQMTDGKPNWHDDVITKPNPKVYNKFLSAFQFVARDLALKFPGRQIINVTDGSRLDVFPKVSLKDHFEAGPWAQG
jgi:hypothetical protein